MSPQVSNEETKELVLKLVKQLLFHTPITASIEAAFIAAVVVLKIEVEVEGNKVGIRDAATAVLNHALECVSEIDISLSVSEPDPKIQN